MLWSRVWNGIKNSMKCLSISVFEYYGLLVLILSKIRPLHTLPHWVGWCKHIHASASNTFGTTLFPGGCFLFWNKTPRYHGPGLCLQIIYSWNTFIKCILSTFFFLIMIVKRKNLVEIHYDNLFLLIMIAKRKNCVLPVLFLLEIN